MAVITHYDNLKVARNAPDSVIRAAYRALAQQYHPDKNGGSVEAERIMMLVNAAYETLSDPEKRREHDAWIEEQERLETVEAQRYMRATPAYSTPLRPTNVAPNEARVFGSATNWEVLTQLLICTCIAGAFVSYKLNPANAKTFVDYLSLDLGILASIAGITFILVICASVLSLLTWIFWRKNRAWAVGWCVAVLGLSGITISGRQAFIRHEAESAQAAPQITQQAQAAPRESPAQTKCGNKHIPALRKIEAQSPELDPCSAKYDQRIVDLIVVRAEQYKAEGQADVDAIVLAYNDYIKSHRIRSE